MLLGAQFYIYLFLFFYICLDEFLLKEIAELYCLRKLDMEDKYDGLTHQIKTVGKSLAL